MLGQTLPRCDADFIIPNLMGLDKQKLVDTLRCPACNGVLSISSDEEGLSCRALCNLSFPVINGIPRMLLSPFREALLGNGSARLDAKQVETALSLDSVATFSRDV